MRKSPEDLQKVVMSIIYDEIKRGETGSREKFGEVDAFLRGAGCDCAILGCTELPIIYEKYAADVTCKKIYDPLKIALEILKEEYDRA